MKEPCRSCHHLVEVIDLVRVVPIDGSPPYHCHRASVSPECFGWLPSRSIVTIEASEPNRHAFAPPDERLHG